MTIPYVGEIRLFAFPRVPTGWFACDGSLKPISEYEVLYTLIGTTYGGDGVQTFALPDMRGQVPLHQGTGPGLTPRVLGETGGSEQVTVLSSQMPGHDHIFAAATATATAITPGPGLQFGALSNTSDHLYLLPTGSAPTKLTMGAQAIGMMGNTTPHNNLMPTLTLSSCIAWQGVFPSRN